MKIGIDLGTTNSALAYIDEREAEDRDFPPPADGETKPGALGALLWVCDESLAQIINE